MFFSAHGNIKFLIQNKCVINKPDTSFNEEGVHILFANIIGQIQKQQVDGWVLIEVLGPDALPTPEALQALADSYKKIKEHGCIKISAVCSNSLQKQFLIKAAELAKINIYFSSSEAAALEYNERFL